jgi:hypothetical protein
VGEVLLAGVVLGVVREAAWVEALVLAEVLKQLHALAPRPACQAKQTKINHSLLLAGLARKKHFFITKYSKPRKFLFTGRGIEVHSTETIVSANGCNQNTLMAAMSYWLAPAIAHA